MAKDDVIKIFGHKLKQFRKSKYKAQSDVAKHVGIETNRVSAWEQAEISGMTLVNFGKVAEFFGIDPEELRKKIEAPKDAITPDMLRRIREREAAPAVISPADPSPSLDTDLANIARDDAAKYGAAPWELYAAMKKTFERLPEDEQRKRLEDVKASSGKRPRMAAKRMPKE